MTDPHDDRAPVDDGADRGADPDESTEIEDGVASDDDEPASRDDVSDSRDEESGQELSTGRTGTESDASSPRDQESPDQSSLRDPLTQEGVGSDRAHSSTRETDHHSKTHRSIDQEARKPARTRQPSSDGGDRWRHVLQYAFDIASSVLIVVLIGALLFATSGVWPPLVAIESASMEPHIDTGDLVFVMDEQRFPGPGATGDSGIVPARAGEETGYRMFEGYGDVVIYEPDGNGEATPIIHRAMFWVENGENWYDRADPAAIGNADSCEELANCPAPHAGFITKGDNNQRYDQVGSQFSGPVKPEWVIGTAEYGVPGLGQVRLLSGEVRSVSVTTTNVTDATRSANSVGVSTLTP